MKQLSISDDDFCNDCKSLHYDPGELSTCEYANPEWPATFDENGYAISCKCFLKILSQGDNWVKTQKETA